MMIRRTLIGTLIEDRMRVLSITQADVCMKGRFDQGLLSKLRNGRNESINLESALKLALALEIAPGKVFEALGRCEEWEGLIEGAYGEEKAKATSAAIVDVREDRRDHAN